MEESKLFGALLPAHPDLLPILKDVREKYNIPEVGPEDDGITEILLAAADAYKYPEFAKFSYRWIERAGKDLIFCMEGR